MIVCAFGLLFTLCIGMHLYFLSSHRVIVLSGYFWYKHIPFPGIRPSHFVLHSFYVLVALYLFDLI